MHQNFVHICTKYFYTVFYLTGTWFLSYNGEMF
nr:MAG TPA: hypothetical protein [Caudoviricetes sp.]